MSWFKNLNASPRLRISFGASTALAIAISCIGVASPATSNNRTEEMYKYDPKGFFQIGNIFASRLSVLRDTQDSILKIGKPAPLAKDHKLVDTGFANIHARLDMAQTEFSSTEGQNALASIRKMLPDYEQACKEVLARSEAGDEPGARAAALAKASQAGETLGAAIQKAISSEEGVGAARFHAHTEAYQSTRALVIAASVFSLLVGVALSVFIAGGFSAPLGLAVVALEQVAAGNLAASLRVSTKDEFGRMSGALNRAVANLRSILRGVAQSAAIVGSSSREMARSASALASRSQTRAASLEETSASLEQITATIRQSADSAQQASQLAAASLRTA